MEGVGLGLLLVGAAWSAGFAFAHFRAAGKAKAAESWPTAFGKILAAQVKVEESSNSDGDSTTWYNPVVEYAYTANGRELEGRTLRFGNPRSANRKKADAAIAPYAVGSSIPVRYNPEHPEESVLETRKPSPIYLIMAFFGLPFIAIESLWTFGS